MKSKAVKLNSLFGSSFLSCQPTPSLVIECFVIDINLLHGHIYGSGPKPELTLWSFFSKIEE